MIALKILDIPKMLHAINDSESFDSFALQELSIITDSALILEGRVHKEYNKASSDTQQELSSSATNVSSDFVAWKQVRQVASIYLSNRPLPLSYKIVLQAPISYQSKLVQSPMFTADPDLVKALVLTFRYEHETLTCLTGTSFTTFVADKSLDTLWDNAIKKSLAQMQIDFEQL